MGEMTGDEYMKVCDQDGMFIIHTQTLQQDVCFWSRKKGRGEILGLQEVVLEKNGKKRKHSILYKNPETTELKRN